VRRSLREKGGKASRHPRVEEVGRRVSTRRRHFGAAAKRRRDGGSPFRPRTAGVECAFRRLSDRHFAVEPVSAVLRDGCQPAESPKGRHSARSEAQSRNPPRPQSSHSARSQNAKTGKARVMSFVSAFPSVNLWPPSGVLQVSLSAASLHQVTVHAPATRNSERRVSTRRVVQQPSFREKRSARAVIPRGAQRSRGIHPRRRRLTRRRGEREANSKGSHSARSEAQSRNPPCRLETTVRTVGKSSERLRKSSHGTTRNKHGIHSSGRATRNSGRRVSTRRVVQQPSFRAKRSAKAVIPRGAKRSRGIHPDPVIPHGPSRALSSFRAERSAVAESTPPDAERPPPIRKSPKT
jgi:hypothetical protein